VSESPIGPRVEGGTRLERAFASLASPRLSRFVALCGVLLTAPSLFIGFHLDDDVHRYLLGDYPGSAALLRAYESPFGIANGEPAVNRWQVDHGYAPWWTEPTLLVSLWRPLSRLSHVLDAALWPNAALPMHAHSLLWYGALCWAAALYYRRLLGATTVAGLAALLYATDHAHGFAVGWIANRNAIITTCFGVLALYAHARARDEGRLAPALLAPLSYAAALLSGESSVAVLGYLVGHALCVDRAGPRAALRALWPFVLLTLGWRFAYNLLGHGAVGSGLYLDPVREPLSYALGCLQRVPMLVLGQLALPPAESYLFLGPSWRLPLLGLALAVTLLFARAAWPLLRGSGTAGCLALGMAGSLLAACSTHPNNRLLFYVGLGALGLLSELWHGFVQDAAWVPRAPGARLLTHATLAPLFALHLFVSPLLLPVTACSVALTAPVREALDSPTLSGEPGDLGEQQVLLVSAPDYFYTKLISIDAELSGRRAPRTLHVLSYGPVALTLTREGPRELRVDYASSVPARGLMELYGTAERGFELGSRHRFQGMELEVLAVELAGGATNAENDPGRPRSVRFRFDAPLDGPGRRVLAWDGQRYAPFALPAPGQRVRVPAARVPLPFGS
jgi:hypothetical protein